MDGMVVRYPGNNVQRHLIAFVIQAVEDQSLLFRLKLSASIWQEIQGEVRDVQKNRKRRLF